jgi:hypothetical protein
VNRWAPGSHSLPDLLGPKGIKTVAGENAWSELCHQLGDCKTPPA